MPKIPARDDSAGPHLPPASQPGVPGAAPQGAPAIADHALMAARYNEASVTDAHAGLLDNLNTLLHDPATGYLNLQGKSAVSAFNAAVDALGKLPQKMSDGLDNDQQRAMFDKAAQPTVGAAIQQVQQHAARQMAAYETDASKARAAAAADLAANAYNPKPGADNTPYRQALITQKLELEKQAAQQGLTDPALRDHYLQFGPDGQSGLAATYTNIVTGLLNRDQAPAARNYFEQVRDHLPEAMRDKLAGYVEDAEAKHQGQTAALHAQAQSPDAAEQHKILDRLKDDGTLSDTAHAIAQQTLQAQAAQLQTQQTDHDKQILARVWDLKHTNPHPAITDLSAADWAYLKSRGLDTQAHAILDGHPASDDPKRYNDLHRLSADDPVKFAQTNLLAESGNLSRAHMSYLQGVQDAINKQDPQQMQASRVVNDAVQMVNSQMQAAGLDLDREPGSKEAATHAAFEAGLRDKIIAAQQAKNSAPLSRDEVRGIAMGYLSDHLHNNTSIFALPGRAAEEKGKHDLPDIPEDHRSQIADELRRVGLPADEDNVRRAYQIAQGEG